jgi:hypothetical protein
VVCTTIAVLALCPLPQAASDTLRVLSVVLGVLAALLPIAAVALTVQWAFQLGGRLGGTVPSDTPIHYTLTHAGAGTWVASAGFLLLGIAGAFGPMRSRSR